MGASSGDQPRNKPGLTLLPWVESLAARILIASWRWLDEPNDQLDGLPPEDVARSPDGWAKVMSLLKRAD